MKLLSILLLAGMASFTSVSFAVTAKVNLNVTMTGLSTMGQLPVKNPSSNCPSVQGPRVSTFEALTLGTNWKCNTPGAANTWHCQYTTTLTGSTPTDGSSTPVYLKVTSYHPNGVVTHGTVDPKTGVNCQNSQYYQILSLDKSTNALQVWVDGGWPPQAIDLPGSYNSEFKAAFSGALNSQSLCRAPYTVNRGQGNNTSTVRLTYSSSPNAIRAWNAYLKKYACLPSALFISCSENNPLWVPINPPQGTPKTTCPAAFSTQTAWLGFNVPNSGSMLNANAFGGSVSTFCSSLIESGIGSDWGTSISSKIRSDLISACNGQGVNKLSDTKTLEVTVPITCHYDYSSNTIASCGLTGS